VVAFALKFLAGYGNTLISSSSNSSSSYFTRSSQQQTAASSSRSSSSSDSRSSSSGSSSDSSSVGLGGRPLASFGVDPARDGGLGMQRLVSHVLLQPVAIELLEFA
jgi:hypothetical protein